MAEGITEEHLRQVCKLGSGGKGITCSFLTFEADSGFKCTKGTDLEPIIRQRRAAGTMKAMGDNCEGRVGSVMPSTPS